MGRNVSAADTLLRQWHMLRALPRYPAKFTTAELRSKLAAAGYRVTPRTLQRDLQELSATFPLVADDRARPFGWAWAQDAPLFDLPGLTTDQAVALAMIETYLKPLLPHALLTSLAPYFKEAARRLAGDAPRRGSTSWLDKIAVVQPTQALLPPKIDAAVQREVTDALFHDRQVSVRYRRKGERKPGGYVLNPLGLIQRGPITYLLATAQPYDDPLLFDLHRIGRARVLDTDLKRPKGFALAAYLAKSGALHFGGGATLALDALFDRAAAEHLQETPLAADQTITDSRDGRVRVRATLLDTPQLRWWLLGMGDNVEVVGPKSLRAELATTTAAMAARYAS